MDNNYNTETSSRCHNDIGTTTQAFVSHLEDYNFMANQSNTNVNTTNDDEEAATIASAIIQLELPSQDAETSIKKVTETPIENASENVDRIDIPGTASHPVPTKAKFISKSDHIVQNIKIHTELIKSLNLTSISFQNNPLAKIVNLNISHENARENQTEDVRKIILSYLNQINDDSETPPVVQTANDETIIVNPVTIETETETRSTTENYRETPTNKEIAEVHKPLPQIIKENVHKPVNLEPRRVDSLTSYGSNVCRICMTRGRERLVSPCNCKGSMASVHLSCLERWLNQVGRNQCELCGFNYPAIRTPRYTVLQALRLWFGNPRNRNHLQSDCLIFWLLSTVTGALLAVCIYGTQYFVIEGNKYSKVDAGVSRRLTETAMDLFMALVLFGYSVTACLLWKDHYSMWNRWRRANVNVRLLLSPDASPVPFVPRTPLQV